MSRHAESAVVATGSRWRRSALLYAALLVIVPFTLILVLVEDHWGPLSSSDQGARDALHAYGLNHSGFVTGMRVLSNSGSALAWQVVTTVIVLVLLLRRQWRLAIFTVLTISGSSLLNTAAKVLIHRDRPQVAHPFVNEPGASFPSGHAQAAVVGYGVLLLLLFPLLAPRWRRVVTAVAAAMVVGIGFSRIALAAHYVSDVAAGFVLGAAWLIATTAAFGLQPWRSLSSAEPRRSSGLRSPKTRRRR